VKAWKWRCHYKWEAIGWKFILFFQSLCVLGYCMFPLCVSSLLFLFVRHWFIRIPVSIVTFGWASYAANVFLSNSVKTDRKVLTMFPVVLFYLFLSWLVLAQKSYI